LITTHADGSSQNGFLREGGVTAGETGKNPACEVMGKRESRGGAWSHLKPNRMENQEHEPVGIVGTIPQEKDLLNIVVSASAKGEHKKIGQIHRSFMIKRGRRRNRNGERFEKDVG